MPLLILLYFRMYTAQVVLPSIGLKVSTESDIQFCSFPESPGVLPYHVVSPLLEPVVRICPALSFQPLILGTTSPCDSL